MVMAYPQAVVYPVLERRMIMLRTIHNAPFFPETPPASGFQEVWYLRLNDTAAGRAIWLRYTVLRQADSPPGKAETWAIYFPGSSANATKHAAKSSYPLDQFRVCKSDPAAPEFMIHQSFFSNAHVRGEASSLNTHIAWELAMRPCMKAEFDFVPEVMWRWGMVKNIAWTVYEHAVFNGWTEVNGERVLWRDAPGMQGHLAGPRNGYSWVWGHCNRFVDDHGDPAPLLWDGLCARARLGGRFVAPALTAMYLRCGDRDYRFNRLRDSFKIKSSCGREGWDFDIQASEASIHGTVSARMQDYAGVTYEDTDGSKLYCHNSKMSDMEITLAQPGERARRYYAKGCVAYEVVTRTPFPEVPFLI